MHCERRALAEHEVEQVRGHEVNQVEDTCQPCIVRGHMSLLFRSYFH